MKRAIIDYVDERLQDDDSFIRVRDEGDKVTVTFKKFESLDFGGAKEYEVIVSDFDTTVKIFESAHLKVHSYQESRRETWNIDGVEVVIDQWPWLNPFIEIEGNSQEDVKRVAKKLDFPWGDAVFGDVLVVYRLEYPRTSKDWSLARIEQVKFNSDVPGDLVR